MSSAISYSGYCSTHRHPLTWFLGYIPHKGDCSMLKLTWTWLKTFLNINDEVMTRKCAESRMCSSLSVFVLPTTRGRWIYTRYCTLGLWPVQSWGWRPVQHSLISKQRPYISSGLTHTIETQHTLCICFFPSKNTLTGNLSHNILLEARTNRCVCMCPTDGWLCNPHTLMFNNYLLLQSPLSWMHSAMHHHVEQLECRMLSVVMMRKKRWI